MPIYTTRHHSRMQMKTWWRVKKMSANLLFCNACLMPRFIFHLDLNCVVFSVLQPEYPFCVLVCSLAGALKSLQITVSRTVESGMVIVVRRASPWPPQTATTDFWALGNYLLETKTLEMCKCLCCIHASIRRQSTRLRIPRALFWHHHLPINYIFPIMVFCG